LTEAEPDRQPEALERLRRAAVEPDADPEATARHALAVAEDEKAIREAARRLPAPVRLVAATAAAAEPEAKPILWADDPDRGADARPLGTVLRAGEVAILSGAGGVGKSFVSLALARAAALAPDLGNPSGAACGLRVAAGPVAVVSYEDAPADIGRRLARMGDLPERVYAVADPEPLALVERSGTVALGPQWAALWAAVRAKAPALAIVDPASAALSGASTNDGGAARFLMREIAREAAAGGFGVLLIAHDTKATRNATRAGEAPGAGAVAGSSQWWDAARGVLYLKRTEGGLALSCEKANHGAVGWGANLAPAAAVGEPFAGFRLSQWLRDTDAAAAQPKGSDDAEDADEAF